jgi:hypothetical protein
VSIEYGDNAIRLNSIVVSGLIAGRQGGRLGVAWLALSISRGVSTRDVETFDQAS